MSAGGLQAHKMANRDISVRGHQRPRSLRVKQILDLLLYLVARCTVPMTNARALMALRYLAPEYIEHGIVTDKSDVYAFGVVLLELITGRRPVGGFGDGVDIVQWVKRTTSCSGDNVGRIVDLRFCRMPTMGEVTHVFSVAMLCVQENGVERPTMREVVQMLSEGEQRTNLHSPHHHPPLVGEQSSGDRENKCLKPFPDLLA